MQAARETVTQTLRGPENAQPIDLRECGWYEAPDRHEKQGDASSGNSNELGSLSNGNLPRVAEPRYASGNEAARPYDGGQQPGPEARS